MEGAAGVVFADINLDDATSVAAASKELARNNSYRAFALYVDVTREESVEAMMNEAAKKFGRVDYVVTSAGV